jgi:hypothetical protein
MNRILTICLVLMPLQIIAQPVIKRNSTGPVPPQGINIKGFILDTKGITSQQVISGVPTYIWRHGCGPTSLGMVCGYYATHGFSALMPGNASTQTYEVNLAIASEEHYDDYALPIDDASSGLLDDKSVLPKEDRHPDNCIADFMGTSQSIKGNLYGWSLPSDIVPAWVNFISNTVPNYVGTGHEYPFTSFPWDSLVDNVNRNRPMVFLVDVDADGVYDHYASIIGYQTNNDTNYYGCRNTWDTGIYWYPFEQMQEGVEWGVLSCFTFEIHATLPSAAGPISGPANVCKNQTSVDYSVPVIAGATSYIWSLPAGAIPVGSSSTNDIKVDFTNALSGDISVNGHNVNGDGASSTLTVTVNQLPTLNAGPVIAAICQGGTTGALGGSFGGGATSAVWGDGGSGGSFTNNGGSTPNTTTYTAAAGAPASVTLTLTTSGGYCGTISANKILTVNPNPTVNAGPAMAAICQGGTTAGLGGSVGGGATGGTWSTPTGGTFTPNANTLNATWTPPGAYSGTATLTLTTIGGSCGTTSASKNVVVNLPPNVDAGPAVAAICQGGTTGALGGSFGGGATSATWSDGGAGGSFTNNGGLTPNSTTYTAAEGAPALVTLTLTTSGGSCGTTSANKILTVNPNPSVNAGLAMAAICQGGTTAGLGGSVGGGATGGTWSTPAGGTFTPNVNTLNATWTPPGVYSGTATLTLTTSGGSCGTTSASKNVVVNPLPTVYEGPAVAVICQGGTTGNLGGSFGGGATSAVWSDGGAGGSFTNNGGLTPNTTKYTAAAGAPASVTLTLTTSGGSCGTTSSDKILTVNPNPMVNAGPAMAAICQGGTTAGLGGSVGGGATGGTWSTPAGGTFTPNANTLNATWTPPPAYSGTATLTLTTSGGSCGTTSANKTVVVNPLPSVNPGPALAAICQGGTTGALGGSFGGGATSAVWSDGGAGGSFANNGGLTPNTTTYTAEAGAPASVTLTLTTSGGSCWTTSGYKILTVNTNPTVNEGPAMAAICQGGITAGLGGSVGGGATGGVWSTPAGGTFTPNANTLNATWTPPGAYSGTATLTLTTSGGSCGTTSANKTVTVNPNAIITRTSSIGSDAQTRCVNTSITNITYSITGGGTGAVAEGLPAGVNSSFAGGIFTISGIPTETGIFYYTVTTTGTCGQTSATGSITIVAIPTADAGLSANTCVTTTYGVTGASANNYSGVTWTHNGLGSFSNSNTLTPTYNPASGDAGKTVVLTLHALGNGNCSEVTSNKNLLVNPLPAAAGGISGQSVVCQDQTSVTYTVPTILNATTYLWTLPTGATGTSTTRNITVDYSASAVSGTITVKGNNSCGYGASSNLPVTVNPLPATPIITQNDNILHSDATIGNQWYNQAGLITGATNQDYTVTSNGNYYVIVTLNGCNSNSSNTINVVLTRIESPEKTQIIKVYPNPFTNELIIEKMGNTINTKFEILNSLGQIIFKGNFLEKTVVQTSNFSYGMYIIKIENGKDFDYKKMVKQ